MTRKDMIDKMTAIYGKEHLITKDFTQLCMNWEVNEYYDDILLTILTTHEKYPCED